MGMRESKDINKIELYDLFANLKAYEFEINSMNEDESSMPAITKALVTTEKSPTSTTTKSAEHICDDAISLFVKKFRKFMRKNHSNSNSNRNNNKNESNANLRCFNYDKTCHFKVDCRKPKRDYNKLFDKKNKKEQKALLAEESKKKWADSNSDYNSSSESEDESVK
ncbi:serine/threonine-protein kinase pakD-like [Impatiens glandulifera]|uniref:serine/threonine-protein kinase pakD-like n=1 Tax=Impatiens glandulifera TaxID=253017 RepID=UPI001FB0BA12|nr:serine/threonine-protein kinase pakD-like [Impatiens glandulifera]